MHREHRTNNIGRGGALRQGDSKAPTALPFRHNSRISNIYCGAYLRCGAASARCDNGGVSRGALAQQRHRRVNRPPRRLCDTKHCTTGGGTHVAQGGTTRTSYASQWHAIGLHTATRIPQPQPTADRDIHLRTLLDSRCRATSATTYQIGGLRGGIHGSADVMFHSWRHIRFTHRACSATYCAPSAHRLYTPRCAVLLLTALMRPSVESG